MSRYLLLVSLCLVWVGPASAIDEERAFEDPVLEERYRALNHELRCLVCQNQSIAESNAGLAKDLRRQVREMLEAGASDEEIRSYMTERYGDFVRYRPAFNERTWALWLGPVAIFLVGGGLLATALLRRRRLPIEDEEEGP